ncbi:MAG: ABC transporter substrate-binding protein [Alphaproteobacteria bacterium]
MTKRFEFTVDRRGFIKGVGAAASLPIVTGAMLPRLAMAQKRGGVLRASLLGFGVVNTLDPQKAALNSDFWTLSTAFNALVKFDADMKIVGDLAESWSNPKPTTLQFKLRKGVKFHDDTEFTAEDVKYTLDRVRTDANGSPNRAKFFAIDQVDVVSKHEVRITTKEPYTPLLAFLTNTTTGSQIISSRALAKMGEQAFSRAPVGTGAFKVVDWKQGEKIVFAAHKNYFEKGLPYLDGVEIILIPEETSGITAILGNQIDIASTAPFADVQKLEKTPGIVVKKSPGLNIRFTAMNLTKPPFNDVHLRRALSMAINREAIVDAVLFGEGRPMFGPIPSAIGWAHDPNRSDLTKFNPERARAEMAKGQAKPGLEIKVQTWGAGWWKRWTEIFCAQVNEVLGVRFSPEVLDANVAFSNFRTNNIQAQNTGWIGRVEAEEYAGALFHSKGERNFGGYANPEVDKLIEASRREFNQAKRAELLKKMSAIVVEEMPIVFAINNNAHNMWRENVKGFAHVPMQSFGGQFPPVSLG